MPENKIYIKKPEAQPVLHTRPQINMIYVTGLIIKSTNLNSRGQCFGGWGSIAQLYSHIKDL